MYRGLFGGLSNGQKRMLALASTANKRGNRGLSATLGRNVSKAPVPVPTIQTPRSAARSFPAATVTAPAAGHAFNGF